VSWAVMALYAAPHGVVDHSIGRHSLMLSSGREGGVWKPVRELHYRIAAALRADDGRESPMHPCAQTGSLSHLSSSDRTNLPMGDRRLWGVVT